MREEVGLLSFDAPENWGRRSIVVFVGPREGDAPEEPTIVATSERRGAAETVQAHAWKRILEMSKRTPDAALVGCTDVVVDGRPGMRAFYRFTSTEGKAYEQTIVWVEGAEEEILVFTCTSTGMPHPTEAFDRALASLRRRPTAVRTPSVRPPTARSSDPPPGFLAVPIPGVRHVPR